MEAFRINVVNPRKKGKKKMAKKRTSRRRPAATRRAPAKRRRPRRRNPSPAPNPKRRRSRRRNPSVRGLGKSLFSELHGFLPRLAGKVAVAWATRRFSTQQSLLGQAYTSPTYGGSWGFGQYLVALGVALVGPRLVGRFLNPAEFRRGALDLIFSKAIWTEGIARSPWMQAQFGNLPDGQVQVDPGTGQTWVSQGGRWTALQGGYGDALVSSSPLDGLVEQSSLDGDPSYSYGHLLPSGTPSAIATRAAYTGSGYENPYHAAFNRG